jgi:hypothetical protein
MKTSQLASALGAAHSANNVHTETLVQFAADTGQATAGKLKITAHAKGSLFKANEIERAGRGGQAQIGEVRLVLETTQITSPAGFTLLQGMTQRKITWIARVMLPLSFLTCTAIQWVYFVLYVVNFRPAQMKR